MRIFAVIAAVAASSFVAGAAGAAEYRVAIPRYMLDTPAGLEAAAARIESAARAACKDADIWAPGDRAGVNECVTAAREEIVSRIGEPRLVAHVAGVSARVATN
ncbi:MAG: UrcA family protein [Parvularculaceae bacterium]|nr:UrcA family protein [Parvularculaceae bacterium]